MFDISVHLSQLKLWYKMYIPDIVLHNIPHAGENVIDVSLLYGPRRNHHLIQMGFDEETQETNMGNQDGDKYVPYILLYMLTESQMHKKNDDHVHEDVEVDIVLANNDVINNHDHVVEDLETMCEDVINVIVNSEDFDLIGLNVDLVVTEKSRNTMLSTKEDGSFYDTETFNRIAHIGAIIFIPSFNYATDKDGVIKKGDYEEVEKSPFANIMKRIRENLTKPLDKVNQENDHVVINVSDNIHYFVNDIVSIDEGFTLMNNEVHDEPEPVNEGVTKDVDLCKRKDKKSKIIVDGNRIPTNVSFFSLYKVSFHYEEIVLK
ncbi:unnamed protein product [Vicia faba]|uniref:Uncharacterized protein n=1 Tax=Vicia faba TaxID=3906 RepID=A0AAV0ZE46_VICFA|nr:unnamed protein product [Vicia faba]